jgi:putative nucleotidyltransferase with HDIG domain
MFSGNKQLPTAPELYLKFNKMLENPLTSNKKFADLILKDQSMVTKILRLSNSAMYSKRQEITNLTQAITFLGLDTLRNLILQISLVREFNFQDDSLPQFKITTFWEHSLSTAYFATILAKKLKLPPNENYYIGGLLHDIGKLVIYQFYPEKFRDIILMQIEDNATDIQAEEEIIKVNHADIGVFFAENWKFKKEIVDVIGAHHRAHTKLALHVSVVRIANLFSKAAGLCFPWDNQLFEIVGDPTWEILAHYAEEKVDIESLIGEIMVEADNVKESVQELLTAEPQRKI